MPTYSFADYAQDTIKTIEAVAAGGQVVLVEQTIDHRSTWRGLIAGVLHFEDGSELHFREFVDTSQPEPRLMYAYHYHDADKALLFRYDNAAHKPALPQAEHKHTVTGVERSDAPTLERVIDEILG